LNELTRRGTATIWIVTSENVQWSPIERHTSAKQQHDNLKTPIEHIACLTPPDSLGGHWQLEQKAETAITLRNIFGIASHA
jgi:hypothetical protein